MMFPHRFELRSSQGIPDSRRPSLNVFQERANRLEREKRQREVFLERYREIDRSIGSELETGLGKLRNDLEVLKSQIDSDQQNFQANMDKIKDFSLELKDEVVRDLQKIGRKHSSQQDKWKYKEISHEDSKTVRQLPSTLPDKVLNSLRGETEALSTATEAYKEWFLLNHRIWFYNNEKYRLSLALVSDAVNSRILDSREDVQRYNNEASQHNDNSEDVNRVPLIRWEDLWKERMEKAGRLIPNLPLYDLPR